MVSNKKEKVTVNIQYPCYVCANEYSGARQVFKHVENMHGYILNRRQIGHHRPPSDHYRYENDVKKKWDVQHFGCPSCWFHCPKHFENLIENVKNEHTPVKKEGWVPKHPDEIEEYESDQAEKHELQVSDDDEEGKGATTDRGRHSTSVSSAGKKEEDPLSTDEATKSQEGGVKKDSVAGSATSLIKEVGQALTSSSSTDVEATGSRQQGGGDRHDSEVAHEIVQKLNELTNMFKQLFKA